MKQKKLLTVFIFMLLIVLPWQAVIAGGKPVKITAPVVSETVNGSYLITGTGGGATVEVSIDDTTWQNATGGKNWQYTWDTTAESDGGHIVYARYVGDSNGPSVAVIVDNSGGGGATPGAGDVVINEFVANSAVTEWVELYNTTSTAIDLSGYYIDDIDAGGGSPQVIPNGTIIPANGYYVMEFGSFLNNGGDDVRFLDPSLAVLDSTTYGSATAEYSWYRYPDGGTWSGAESDSPTKGNSNNGTGDQPWVPGTFEIRIFDVEQGDSQLIIFPSGFSILIDVREASWNTGATAALVAAKIRTITGGSHVNVGVLSHHHLDHIGYAGYGGFWGLIETEGITFDKIVDRDAGMWVDGSGGGANDGLCDPDLEIVWHNAGQMTGTSRNWLCYATNSANTAIYNIREIAQSGSTTQIDPPDANAVVEVIMADGDGVMLADGVTPLSGDHTAEYPTPSENDYSVAIKIRYGLIDYATAGDADGEYADNGFGSTYNDLETVLADRFGQVDLLHSNHHGSRHSSNQYYVDTLNPDVSTISCGSNTYGHPGQEIIDRLLFTGDVYITNLCDVTRNYGSSNIVNGDIILKSTNGTNYTINGVAYVASDQGSPPPPPPSSSIADLVINEVLPAPSAGAEWIELYNPTSQDIDASGGWIDDIAGGGGSAKVIPNGTTVPAGGYWTMDTSSFFNNGGDDARLLMPDGVTVIDSYTYGSTGYDVSWYRTPDGGAWAGSTGTPTKGTANP